MVSLRIRNDHLKNYIIPIFDKYPMFSNKQYYYLWFKKCLFLNIVLSKDLPTFIKNYENLNYVQSITNTWYFTAWLVGFIEAEGCLSIYYLKKDNAYKVASFYIGQTNGNILISAISKYLSFTTSIYLDKTNCLKLKV